MSDIKLFRIAGDAVTELSGTTDTIEKSVQTLFERNLESLLGVRFLATEYVTTNGGRIDSLGLDENGSPVILEYKRATNENVVNQGLFYLDWLMDHRKNFEWLVMDKLGKATADLVEWSAPRLICIAGDFNRYDEHAVRQMQRNVELIRYRRFGNDLVMLDLVTATSRPMPPEPPVPGRYKPISSVIDELDAEMRDRFEALRDYLTALGDDVQETVLRLYVAYKRIRNFAGVDLRPTKGQILIYAKIDLRSVTLEQDFTRDVTDIGHYGTGDLEITLSKAADLERAMPLIQRSYDNS